MHGCSRALSRAFSERHPREMTLALAMEIIPVTTLLNSVSSSRQRQEALCARHSLNARLFVAVYTVLVIVVFIFCGILVALSLAFLFVAVIFVSEVGAVSS